MNEKTIFSTFKPKINIFSPLYVFQLYNSNDAKYIKEILLLPEQTVPTLNSCSHMWRIDQLYMKLELLYIQGSLFLYSLAFCRDKTWFLFYIHQSSNPLGQSVLQHLLQKGFNILCTVFLAQNHQWNSTKFWTWVIFLINTNIQLMPIFVNRLALVAKSTKVLIFFCLSQKLVQVHP